MERMSEILVEQTLNPETLKFLPGRDVSPQSPASFTNAKEAHGVPLVESLFGVQGVLSVFLGRDFVSITKENTAHWDKIRPNLLTVLKDFFAKDFDIIEKKPEQQGEDPLEDVST